MSTFYNLEEGTCDCYALEDTPTGEEFLIFYGSRANYDLLIHQGFVFMRNKSDALQIRLGESLYWQRCNIQYVDNRLLKDEYSGPIVMLHALCTYIIVHRWCTIDLCPPLCACVPYAIV